MNKPLKEYAFLEAGTPGSFARFTLESRLPTIVKRVIGSGLYSGSILARLLLLQNRVPDIQVQKLELTEEEMPYWQTFTNHYTGRELLDIPFFFAEIYFYALLLDTCGYAQNGIDPFGPIKHAETVNNISRFEATLSALKNAEIHDLLLYSLTGNRADLSQLQHTSQEDLHLIGDDSSELIRALGPDKTLHLILDNAGVELFSDLCLVYALLDRALIKEAVLYPKKHPLLVSDATPQDLAQLLAQLKPIAPSFVERVEKWMHEGVLQIKTDIFWNTPNHFTDMPLHLKNGMAGNGVLIAKGDANYRRFYEDRAIPGHFMGGAMICENQFAIRTLKSEIVAGISQETTRSLSDKDSDWMTNGKYAVIQKIR